MKKQDRWLVLLILGTMFLLWGATTNLSALVYLNGSDWAFDESVEPTKAIASVNHFSPSGIQRTDCGMDVLVFPTPGKAIDNNSNNLHFYIVKGASHLFKSNSSLFSFYESVELSELEGPDYNSLSANLDKAIVEMKKALEYYKSLKDKADCIPYDKDNLAKLKRFKFEEFCKKYRLKRDTFDRVRADLAHGRIREVYGETISNVENLLEIAVRVETTLKTKKFPAKSALWALTLAREDAILFGQYVAQIFYEVKANN